MQAQAQEVDPISKKVKAGSQAMSYDYLVVTTGGGMRLEEVPWLDVYAETIWMPAAMLRLRWAFQKLVEDVKQEGRPRIHSHAFAASRVVAARPDL
ncbi:MAG TPA: hypothetical protein VIC84_20015 [Blastocatellia bacterium]